MPVADLLPSAISSGGKLPSANQQTAKPFVNKKDKKERMLFILTCRANDSFGFFFGILGKIEEIFHPILD